MDNPILPIDDKQAFRAINISGERHSGEFSAPFVILQQGQSVKSVEHLCPKPFHASGETQLDDAESYIGFTQQHGKDNDKAAVFYQANENKCAFTSIFNMGTEREPEWQDFRASYSPVLSPEWLRWFGNDNKAMGQVAFAEFIEMNAVDIRVPVSADMIAISRSLEAKKTVNFASAVRLDNGAREFAYEETIKGTAQKGTLQIPEQFTLGIPVFVGGLVYAVDAMFRYTIGGDGKLTLRYQLVRPHKVVEHAVGQLVAQVRAECALPVFRGTAPALR